jgi:hypothetical protein
MRLIQLGLVAIAIALGFVRDNVIAQNNAVKWSTVDAGFAHSVSGNSSLQSIVGQSFVGNARSGVQIIESGFFADTLFRATLTAIGRDIAGGIPAVFQLSQNFPNPFNPTTTIRYGLAHRVNVTLIIYNTLGQQVATLVNEDLEAGYHDMRFDGRNLASGVYFYRLQAGDFVQTRKLLLLR